MASKRQRKIERWTCLILLVYHSQSLVDLCVTMSNKSLRLSVFKNLSFFHGAFLTELIL